MKKLKILIIGPASYPGGLVGSYVRAFYRIAEVATICFDTEKEAFSSRVAGYSFIIRAKRRCLHYINNIILRKKLITYISKKSFGDIDLIFDFKSYWLKPEDILKLKNLAAAPVFHFNADSPFDKQKANYFPNLIKAIPHYDCYFTWSKKLIPLLQARGANSVVYLPFAWDPGIHPFSNSDLTKNQEYESDVSFIGNWTPAREKWLENLVDFNLTIWGEPACQWVRMEKGSKLFQKWKPFSVRESLFGSVVRSSKINLNFLREQNLGSHNMRSFEVPGCGGFLLTQRSEEQCEFFEEGKEIACFSTADELKDKINFYLPKEGLRRQMSQAAHQKVEQGHTYFERAGRILNVYHDLMS